MPKRLSLFCSCLPRKQRDNLSSRALYHDQDSSSGLDDYSDDEDDPYHDRYRNSPARLEALRPSLARDSTDSTTHNPWPSSFAVNGRFSKQANHHPNHQHYPQSSSRGSRRGGGQSPRKPNPFREEGPYRDDTSSDDEEEGSNVAARASSSSFLPRQKKKSIFRPYRDDESEEDAEALREEEEDPYTTLWTNREGGPTQVQDAPRMYPKMEYTPYRVETGVSTGQPGPPRRRMPPRNPQGQHMAWRDDGKEDRRGPSSADADAEEIIDVDALIAEQERITKELAAQEEALRKEEEDLIQKKRLAAIDAAEKRGLLRFEGSQLVIPSHGDYNNIDSHSNNQTPPSSTSVLQKQHLQPEGGNERSSSGRPQRLVPLERTTSSAGSSYVGGIDAFDQELKLMSLDVVKDHRQETTAASRSSASTSKTPANPTRPSVAVRTVSTGVSTSTSTFVVSPTLNINPRGVLNNITSFLKKVDGVIAGESSDEASFSDQEQHLDKKNHHYHHHQRTGEPGLVNKGPQESGSLHSASGSGHATGGYSTSTAEGDLQIVRTVAVSVDPLEQQRHPHRTLTGDHPSDETIIYPTDVFSGPSETMSECVSPPGSSLSTLGGRTNGMKRLVDDQKAGGNEPAAAVPPPPPPSSQLLSPSASISASSAAQAPAAAATSEGIFDTFTSFFNAGSSFMGLFGTGHRSEEDDDVRVLPFSDDEKRSRRRSTLQYGDDPTKKHRFDYRDHRLEDDGPPAGGSWSGRKATPAVKNTTPTAAAHASVDNDSDSSSIDDYNF
ncbi:hypothetical protein EC968_003424 [Mortierella alpina]|nr:hypothetical protein EC968_003424 [Mortierella alpina]